MPSTAGILVGASVSAVAGIPGGSFVTAIDSVNSLIVDLVQPNAEVTRVIGAVARGDLTGSIAEEAPGELAALKDNVNRMIANLRETTQKNAEQDWLKTNLAKFTRMLQGERDLLTVARLILSELAPVVNAHHGVFYIMAPGDSPERDRVGRRYGPGSTLRSSGGAHGGNTGCRRRSCGADEARPHRSQGRRGASFGASRAASGGDT